MENLSRVHELWGFLVYLQYDLILPFLRVQALKAANSWAPGHPTLSATEQQITKFLNEKNEIFATISVHLLLFPQQNYSLKMHALQKAVEIWP